ncbi:MAG: sigma-70 family RNA polymerase sigma factor [Deltaproteobacteria bacterium]|nr:sigma-70 family RNA polymerase sigma factor [Deltaproteobacteria bacterium]
MHVALHRYASPRDAGSRVLADHAALLERWVRRIVTRTGLWDLEDDLWVAGAVALVDAHHRFDAARGVPFIAFAGYRIRGAMLDELRRNDHLPRRLRARAEHFRRTREELRQQLGREPTTEEQCARLQCDAETLAGMDNVSDAPLPMLGEQSGPDDLPSPAMATEAGAMKEALAKALTGLPDRLQLLLSLHYVDGLTYREIADILRVSQPRVCQLHAQALKLVRAAMENIT